MTNVVRLQDGSFRTRNAIILYLGTSKMHGRFVPFTRASKTQFDGMHPRNKIFVIVFRLRIVYATCHILIADRGSGLLNQRNIHLDCRLELNCDCVSDYVQHLFRCKTSKCNSVRNICIEYKEKPFSHF